MNPVLQTNRPRAPLAAARAGRAAVGRKRWPAARHDLRAILGEGAAFSIMVGVGESYLPAFALAMGLGQVAAGLVATIPLLAGAVLQLVSPLAVRRLGSHRRWVVWCAALQAMSFLPLAVAAMVGRINVVVMFAVVAVYWGAGQGTSSAWSTWIETIVPARLRPAYFARRTRLGQVATLAGFVVGGFSLQFAAASDRRLWAFAGLFLLACTCRAVSVAFLTTQSEPQPRADGHRRVSLGEFVARFRHSHDGRLLVYLLAVQAAAQVAGPYFTPYMLSSMKMSYASYVTLIGISFAAKALSLPACGVIAARYGTQKLLWVGGLGIVPISGLWLLSNDFAFLVVVQTLAGMTWAAYELAMLLSFFETIRPEERTSVLTWFNLAHSLATAAGSLLGAFLLYYLAKTPQAYLLLFALSSAGRAVAVAGLWRIGSACAERGAADHQVQPRSFAGQIDELPPERLAA